MSNNIFTFIKSHVSILDVIGSYTTLKKAGHYWKSPCPFHSEKTASFTVSPHKEIFYCFGCHESGDVISFIGKVEGCSPLEAARFLSERYHLELPADLQQESHAPKEKKRYFDLCQIIAAWCHTQLKQSSAVNEYLTNRGINPKSIAYFTIGYFPGGLAATKKFIADMAKQNILIADLVAAHFLVQGKNILYSPYEERILFPIKDHLGRFCGFGGRIFKPQDTRPKYYNSHENEFFAKGSLLFGLDLAKKEIQKAEAAFLVEGYTDCVAMVQHGYPNTVATLGTACTLEHLKQLSRYANTVYVLYDGDNAGQQAILRLAQLCWQATIDLRVVRLPASEDPASLLAKKQDLTPLIENATDIFLFFIEALGKDFNEKSLSQKLQLAHKIIDTIKTIDDPLKRDLLLQRAASTLGMPFESLKGEIRAAPEPAKPEHDPARNAILDHGLNVPKLEKKIFFAIMNNMQLLTKENSWYLVTFLPQPLRNIMQTLAGAKELDPQIDFIHFFDKLPPEEQHIVSRILLEGAQQAEERTFDVLLAQLQKNHWKVIVNDIKLKMEQAKKNKDDQQVKELLEEFLNLRKKLIGKELI